MLEIERQKLDNEKFSLQSERNELENLRSFVEVERNEIGIQNRQLADDRGRFEQMIKQKEKEAEQRSILTENGMSLHDSYLEEQVK